MARQALLMVSPSLKGIHFTSLLQSNAVMLIMKRDADVLRGVSAVPVSETMESVKDFVKNTSCGCVVSASEDDSAYGEQNLRITDAFVALSPQVRRAEDSLSQACSRAVGFRNSSTFLWLHV